MIDDGTAVVRSICNHVGHLHTVQQLLQNVPTSYAYFGAAESYMIHVVST